MSFRNDPTWSCEVLVSHLTLQDFFKEVMNEVDPNWSSGIELWTIVKSNEKLKEQNWRLLSTFNRENEREIMIHSRFFCPITELSEKSRTFTNLILVGRKINESHLTQPRTTIRVTWEARETQMDRDQISLFSELSSLHTLNSLTFLWGS